MQAVLRIKMRVLVGCVECISGDAIIVIFLNLLGLLFLSHNGGESSSSGAFVGHIFAEHCLVLRSLVVTVGAVLGLVV